MDNKTICTMCGREFDEWDVDEALHYTHFIGFGSKYDLHIFEANLCCECFDKILDTILPMFKNNPLSEYDIVCENGKLVTKRRENNET